MTRLLFVIGPGSLPSSFSDDMTELLTTRYSPETSLDLLLFRDDGDASLESSVRSHWRGDIKIIGGAKLIAQVDEATRSSLTQFMADLRERLTSVALDIGGSKWAHRFGSLWWKTRLSEKNSPADDIWWQLFRASALESLLQTTVYDDCVLVGDNWFVDVARQVARGHGLACTPFVTQSHKLNFLRVLVTRLLEGAFYLCAIAMSKRRAKPSDDLRKGSAPLTVLYSLFPRVWTDRFECWKDMYYGQFPDILAKRTGSQPVFALRIFDGRGIIPPSEYRAKLRLLDDTERTSQRFVVVEAFASIKYCIRRYLNPMDTVRYFRMARHTEFGPAFHWNGIDTGAMFRDRLLRSALVYWPYLEVLQDSFRRMSGELNPDLLVAYHFEFADGRALIEGFRSGAPRAGVVGIQHGPITSMKMLYSGTEMERIPTLAGGPPIPEPDVYVVDGPAPARVLQAGAIPPERIRVTGAVRFDDVWDEVRRLSEDSVCAERISHATGDGSGKIFADDERARVLVAPGLHDTAQMVKLVSSALGHDPRLELIIKPHPRVSAEAVAGWVGTGRDGDDHDQARITVIRQGSIYEWMTRCDLFLGTYSSTAIEALAFGLPVILMLPNDSPDMSLYHGLSVQPLTASNADDLRRHVDSLLADKSALAEHARRLSPALEECFGPTDGRSGVRLAEVCEELLGGSKVESRRQKVTS